MHLTNYSINKNAKNFVSNFDADHDGEGSKWSLNALKEEFDYQGLDYEELMDQIKDVIIKTLISVESTIVETGDKSLKYRNSCFELYGFDILVDEDLKPWLVEVNLSPSLTGDTPMDKTIKTTLYAQTLNLMGIPCEETERSELFYGDRKKREAALLNSSQKQRQMQYHTTQRMYKKFMEGENGLDHKDMTPYDYEILIEFEEELGRVGDFERLFPLSENTDYYEQFFFRKNYNNMLLWLYLKTSSDFLLQKYPLNIYRS